MSGAAPMRHDRSLRQLLGLNLVGAALIFVLLEIWRPCYFLTDDSMDCFFPVLAGIGQRLLHGQSPFVSDYLFGGHFNILRDCTDFFWHPVYLLAALMAQSPARIFSIDFVALVFLLLAAAGFTCLAHHLRRELGLPLSDARLGFYTLSFTYSMIILCIGPSWVNFLGNHSAMPWLALGILQTSWRRGLGLVTLFSVHHLLAGHLEAAISTSLFLSLFAGGVAVCRRSWLPLLSWVGGYAIAAIVLSPLLVPDAEGFLATARATGLSAEVMSKFAVPALLFPFSYFFSTFSLGLHVPYHFSWMDHRYCAAFVSCAAAWAIIPALVNRSRWTGLQILCLGIVVFGCLMIIRPRFVSEILIHLPILRSMRWPFREIMELQFFLHLFFVLRPGDMSPVFRRLLLGLGLVIFLLPLPFLTAPSFGPMQPDRALLFSGEADRYWVRVKSLLEPGDYVVPIIDPALVNAQFSRVPFLLVGTANYPSLFRFRSATGYSPTVPQDQLFLQTMPSGYLGFFSPAQEPAILAECPTARFLRLESLDPLRVTLSSRSGPPIDVTP